MCEQIECADVLVCNKTDLVGEDEMYLLKETLGELNPSAKVHQSCRGNLDLPQILGAAGEGRMAVLDEDGEMRRLVERSKAQEEAKAKAKEAAAKEHAHTHSHAEKKEGEGEGGHGHEHGHGEKKEGEGEGGHGHGEKEAHSNDHEHSHGHNHEHGHEHGPECGESCGHSHADGHADGHGHEHSHEKGTVAGREAQRFGITSFVYQRRRPFHPFRLMAVIKQLPVRQEALALADALKSSTDTGKVSTFPITSLWSLPMVPSYGRP